MRRTLSLLVLGLTLSGGGAVLAADGDEITVPLSQTGLESDHYVDPDSGIWKETNGCAGMQDRSVNCKGGLAKEPADEQVAELPTPPADVPELPPVPGAPGVPSVPSVPGGVPSVPGGVPPVPGVPGGVPPVPSVPLP